MEFRDCEALKSQTGGSTRKLVTGVVSRVESRYRDEGRNQYWQPRREKVGVYMPYSWGLSIPLLLGRSQTHAMGNLKRRKQINRLAWLEVKGWSF